MLHSCARLKTVVVMGEFTSAGDGPTLTVEDLMRLTPSDFDADTAWRHLGPESTACLIYTSGTTGEPKGVQIPHRAIVASVAQYSEVAPFTPHGRVLSYLPAAHIADRWASHYAAMAGGHTVTCVPDHTTLYDALKDTRPTHFFAVPRILEKLSDRADDVLARTPELADDHVARLAEIRASGEIEPRADGQSRFASIHAELGLDAAEWMTVGSAPSARGFLESMAALDLPFADVWGMTEIIVCSMNRPERLKLGSIGRPMPGIRFEIEDGELLAAGATAFTGYRGDPGRTKEVLSDDGWVRSGDLAEIDADGYVWIRGRKKEMIINSAGKNMSPLTIEGALESSSTLIDHVAVAGDGRRFVVALISLDAQRLVAFAADRGLSGGYAELTRDPAVLAEVGAAVDRGNATLSRVEHVRAWRVVEDEWLPGGEEITASMKLMRNRILRRYAAIVDELYD
jgi:long-subunit acyl-CoA synthetase (AMP-forming)